MVRQFISLGLGALIVATANGHELRQGKVFTPEEGKADLLKRAEEYTDLKSWTAKADKIREGILKGTELWPLPKKTPLNPKRSLAKKADGYQVENVAFESLPGFFVTGNLYLPTKQTNMPMVLCPHGHWKGEKLIEHGRFREDMQKRCGAMARMGCAVFAFDAIGFGESKLLGWEHLFDDKVLKLQLWNGIRSLDFLCSLKGGDHNRILVTGASGGGTMTMQLAAIDKRVTMSVPCAMVSSYFYGGCNCESGMPIHVRPGHVTNPVEIAAVIAPRPMLVISDGGDWTAHTPQDVFPHLKRIYRFYDRESSVENAHFPEGKHDYGFNKRQALYNFMAKHWKLGRLLADEKNVPIIPANQLRVFDQTHPLPPTATKPNTMPGFVKNTAPQRSRLPSK